MKTFIQKKAMCMLMLTMVMLSLGILTSCDSMVYDYEGDCSVTYRLKFRYDMNLKWADAFANEVKSVNVYAFDEKGVLVWQKAERGAALASADYAMTLDLPAGKIPAHSMVRTGQRGRQAVFLRTSDDSRHLTHGGVAMRLEAQSRHHRRGIQQRDARLPVPWYAQCRPAIQ